MRILLITLAFVGTGDSYNLEPAAAVHTAEMIEYMHNYYFPGPGSRAPVEIEAALEKQRRESVELVAVSLERYTDLKYGTKTLLWTRRAEEQKTANL